MTDTYSNEVIQALAELRDAAANSEDFRTLRRAFNTLDNAGVFAALDQQTEYASPEEILDAAELAALNEAAGGLLDPAEWGDTTRLDTARRSHAQA